MHEVRRSLEALQLHQIRLQVVHKGGMYSAALHGYSYQASASHVTNKFSTGTCESPVLIPKGNSSWANKRSAHFEGHRFMHNLLP